MLQCIALLKLAVPQPRERSLAEYYFRSCLQTDDRQKLPSTVHDPATLELSIVIPAYNEAKRLPHMLMDALKHLGAKKERAIKAGVSFNDEVLVVDDGSTDDTVNVALKCSDAFGEQRIRVLSMGRTAAKVAR